MRSLIFSSARLKSFMRLLKNKLTKKQNMSKEKACKNCKLIYEGEQCPYCGKKDSSDSFKGKVEIIDTEKSELSNHLKITKKGLYAIKL